MSIINKKINDIEIEPLQTKKNSIKNTLGYKLIPELYANIFLCAHKKSGKTTVLFNILKHCADKNTKIIFFVSTIDKDDSYKEILKYLDKKEIEYEKHTSMIDGKIDILQNFINKLIKDAETEKLLEKIDEEKDNYDDRILLIDDDDSFKVKIEKQRKIISPEYIFVFDDISAEIQKSKSINALLKMNRHFKSKVIISSQYPNDIQPAARNQIDIWILFRGHNDDKLKLIFDASDPRDIKFEDFLELYNYATKEQYNFLMIDKNNSEYRHNFNIVLDIK